MAISEPPLVTWFVPEGFRARIGRLLGRAPWQPRHSLASVWIRSFQLAEYLKAQGFTLRCNDLSRSPSVAIFLRRYAARDVTLARWLQARGVRIVTDVIVNYFKTQPAHESNKLGGVSERDTESFKDLVRLSDQVWCVSPFLQKLALDHNPASYFVTDSVDPRHFDPGLRRAGAENDPPIFGWSGYAVKAEPLAVLRPWVEAGRVRLCVISDRRPRLGFQYEFKKWDYETFPKDIGVCDLCVAPRNVEDDYDRGHSVFKVAVFMAMGVPALAGSVPSYEQLLGEGRGGAICRSPEDWPKYLDSFLSDPDLPTRWRTEALEAVRPFLTPVVAEWVGGLLRELAN